jgi:hypothetical protein
MVNRRASDAAAPLTQPPVATVAKRKRRASCLGEQERRERKRAIDREAQRSLREKTKTHIAELERTIQILRDQDRNGATSSLLSEIDNLRAENEQLRDVIDSVKSVVGLDLGVSSKTAAAIVPPYLADDGDDEDTPLAATSAGTHKSLALTLDSLLMLGQQSPKPSIVSSSSVTRPPASLPAPIDQPTTHSSSETMRSLDLDGMTVMPDLFPPPVGSNQPLSLEPVLPPVHKSSAEEKGRGQHWAHASATATWAPMMEEVC